MFVTYVYFNRVHNFELFGSLTSSVFLDRQLDLVDAFMRLFFEILLY